MIGSGLTPPKNRGGTQEEDPGYGEVAREEVSAPHGVEDANLEAA